MSVYTTQEGGVDSLDRSIRPRQAGSNPQVSEHHAGYEEPVARQTQEGPKLVGAGGSRRNDHASPRWGKTRLDIVLS